MTDWQRRVIKRPSRPHKLIILGAASFFVGLLIVLVAFTFLRDPDSQEQESTVGLLASAAPPSTIHVQASRQVVETATEFAPPSVPATAEPLSTAQVAVEPTPTLQAPLTPAAHEVAAGETLYDIALLYNVTVADLLAVNNIVDENQIFPGEIVLLPANVSQVETSSTATVAALPGGIQQIQPADWVPSLIAGNLAGNYPQSRSLAAGALVLHYQPGTFPAENLDWLSTSVESGWSEILNSLGSDIGQPVDVFLAGTLFASNPALQGFTQSGLYRSFILVNGAFDRGETNYIIAHELTHIAATYAFGFPSSPMIHEGLAVYLPQEHLVESSSYLSHQEICAAAQQAGTLISADQLSRLAYGADGFGGHIRTFIRYNLSGCFAGYLIEAEGMEKLAQVYASGDYIGVYSRSLPVLDAEWQASLAAVDVSVDPAAFIDLVDEVARAYEGYSILSAGGVHANWPAYVQLIAARRSVNQGLLEQARQELDAYYAMAE